jgi:hypothetical protein
MRHGLCRGEQGRLRERVGEELRVQLPDALVDDVDDGAVLVLGQLPGEVTGQEGGRAQVDGEVPLPKVGPNASDLVGLEKRGVVDEQRHGAERRASLAEKTLDRGEVGKVRLHDRSAPASLLNGGLHLLRVGAGAAVVNGDGVALVGEAERDGAADPFRRAGDEGRMPHGTYRVSAKAGTRRSKSSSQLTSFG